MGKICSIFRLIYVLDTLVKMDRSQLQKFAQYLIASHPNRVLASAQHLADKLLQRDSQMNKTYGMFLAFPSHGPQNPTAICRQISLGL